MTDIVGGRLPGQTLAALRRRRFLVTGPTGWLGTATLHWLRALLGDEFAERVSAFGSSARGLDIAGAPLPVRPLADLAPEDVDGRIVFHFAFLTRDKVGAIADDAYAATNLRIDDSLLRAMEGGGTRGVFVASSGAAGRIGPGGVTDLYALLKLYQETRFAEVAAGTGAPAFIGRIFNVAGPFGNKTGHYALASFITQALGARRIAITADRPVFRSYVHVLDLVALAAASLEGGRPPAQPIDIAGAQVVEMGEIAAAVAETLGGGVAIDRPRLTGAPPSVYLGDPTPFAALALGAGLPLVDFRGQVADTAAHLRAASL